MTSPCAGSMQTCEPTILNTEAGDGFRLLNIGETVPAGAEYRGRDGEWHPCSQDIGKVFDGEVLALPRRVRVVPAESLPPFVKSLMHEPETKAEAKPDDGPGDGWRWLAAGETIEPGDEIRLSGDQWFQVSVTIGRGASRNDVVRRRSAPHVIAHTVPLPPENLAGLQNVVVGTVQAGDVLASDFGLSFAPNLFFGRDVDSIQGARVYRKIPQPKHDQAASVEQAPAQDSAKLGIGGAPTRCTTLPADAKERKTFPIVSGFLDYFPDAVAAVAHVSWKANEQHNPGKPVHWDRSKSGDEWDAMGRHVLRRGLIDSDGLRESAKIAWRAMAALQKEIEEQQK